VALPAPTGGLDDWLAAQGVDLGPPPRG
jgi:hypothetical protein